MCKRESGDPGKMGGVGWGELRGQCGASSSSPSLCGTSLSLHCIPGPSPAPLSQAPSPHPTLAAPSCVQPPAGLTLLPGLPS